MSLKVIYTAQTGTDAVLIRNMLKGAGIEAYLRTDDANGNFPSLDVAEGVGVLVDESVFGDATAIMDEYQRGATAITDDQGE